eukprot:gene41989-52047_t
MGKILKEDKKKRLQLRNDLPILPGKWRQKPFGKRTYEKLSEYHITSNISIEEVKEMTELLTTPLDGFDRVCTENGVLRVDPLGLGSDLKEVPVWGIDSYTRRMVEITIEDR